MDPKHIIFLFQLLSVGQGLNNPQVNTRVYDEDYSVALKGVLVSELSWTSSRLPSTVEKSIVSCASACVDKFRMDVSCNSIMYDRETEKCHFGNTTLPSGSEPTEFVYRIPDGKGKKHLMLWFGLFVDGVCFLWLLWFVLLWLLLLWTVPILLWVVVAYVLCFVIVVILLPPHVQLFLMFWFVFLWLLLFMIYMMYITILYLLQVIGLEYVLLPPPVQLEPETVTMILNAEQVRRPKLNKKAKIY